MTDDRETEATDGLAAIHFSETTRCRLLTIASPDAQALQRTTLLSGRRLAIGRSPGSGPEASLAIDDSAISRNHALLVRASGPLKWRIQDHRSRNGTFVDGVRIEDVPLSDGAVIRLGQSVLLFQRLTLKRGEVLEPERPPLLGSSAAMSRIRHGLERVASTTTPVLIVGPSGVGKEICAGEIHRLSKRAGPFVPVNSSALPEALVESELFGHMEGAFTGASARSAGLFKAADGGTLFLDEIGELSPRAQAKLLRVLDRGEVRAVGGDAIEILSVRIVAATNRDLEAEVAQGRFRGDLYARLSGFVVMIPPFNERCEDVLSLARPLLEERGRRKRLSANAVEALLLYQWPYNGREIQRAVKSAADSAGSFEEIDLCHLPPEIQAVLADRVEPSDEEEGKEATPESKDPAMLALVVQRDGTPSKAELEMVLSQLQGNIARVADLYGRDRRQIYRWAERLDIDLGGFREGPTLVDHTSDLDGE